MSMAALCKCTIGHSDAAEPPLKKTSTARSKQSRLRAVLGASIRAHYFQKRLLQYWDNNKANTSE